MPVTITFLGHAGFLLKTATHAVAIDPFLTDNPVAKQTAKEIECQSIVLSHGHEDHVGDTVQIAKANDATVYGAFELCSFLEKKGCKISDGNPGGQQATPFGFIAFTQAFHSSSHGRQYMGMPCGIIVHFSQERFTFHHTGDTALFGDLRLIGEIYQPDVSAICCGDRYTMGPKLAAKAAELIKPKYAIPIHYGTWPVLTSDISAFKPAGVTVKVMAPGESWLAG